MKFWKGVRSYYVKSNAFHDNNKKTRNTNLDAAFMDWWKINVPPEHRDNLERATMLRQMIRYQNCCLKFRRVYNLDPNPRESIGQKIKMHAPAIKKDLALALR